MALPDPASHQSPLSIDSTIYGIAEMIDTGRDLISFAQVSRQVYASAIRVLYRYIRVAPAKRASDWDERIPKYAYTKDYISTMVQRVALLETLESNTQLAAAVTKLHIFTKPVEFLDRILAACPNLTTLKLEFSEWNPHENKMIARSERLEVPIIPSTVKRLDFIHDGRGQIKRESITQAFSNATLLESVSLCTNVETAQTILKSAGRSITSLKLGSLRGVAIYSMWSLIECSLACQI